MGSWVRSAAALLVALMLTALPAAAQVPDPFARNLAQKLARGEVVLTENGYARAAGPFAGGLDAGQWRRYSVMLRAGQDYRVVAVCDSRCEDMDLRLFDPNNRLIGQNVLDDAVPVIHVRPAVTGQYTIESGMVRCSGAPCWFAFNVYSR